jgi:hypothetical protein
VGDSRQIAGDHAVGRVGARDLYAGEDRLASTGGDVQAVEEPPRGELGRASIHGTVDRLDRFRELVRRHGRAAAGLAAPVAHTLVPQLEAKLLSEVAGGRVAGQDELGAHLDHRSVLELARPHPSSDPIARLEHDDLDARPAQLVGGAQSGEAGADNRGSHGRAGRAVLGPDRSEVSRARGAGLGPDRSEVIPPRGRRPPGLRVRGRARG